MLNLSNIKSPEMYASRLRYLWRNRIGNVVVQKCCQSCTVIKWVPRYFLLSSPRTKLIESVIIFGFLCYWRCILLWLFTCKSQGKNPAIHNSQLFGLVVCVELSVVWATSKINEAFYRRCIRLAKTEKLLARVQFFRWN